MQANAKRHRLQSASLCEKTNKRFTNHGWTKYDQWDVTVFCTRLILALYYVNKTVNLKMQRCAKSISKLGDHIAHGTVVQFVVESFALDQLFVCSFLYFHSTACKHDYLVGVHYRLETMSNHDAGTIFRSFIQCLLHQFFRFIIQCTCGCAWQKID